MTRITVRVLLRAVTQLAVDNAIPRVYICPMFTATLLRPRERTYRTREGCQVRHTWMWHETGIKLEHIELFTIELVQTEGRTWERT